MDPIRYKVRYIQLPFSSNFGRAPLIAPRVSRRIKFEGTGEFGLSTNADKDRW